MIPKILAQVPQGNEYYDFHWIHILGMEVVILLILVIIIKIWIDQKKDSLPVSRVEEIMRKLIEQQKQAELRDDVREKNGTHHIENKSVNINISKSKAKSGK